MADSEIVKILVGDCRETLKTIPAGTVHCCVTSPPYWGLRSYLPAGHDDKRREIGSEPTQDAYVQTMVDVFREVRRVLHDSATLWLNLGDSMSDKCCAMIPERVALALVADGWLLRSKIVWAKKSCMPESVTDRPTNSWEPIFLLAKSAKYFYDAEAVKETSTGRTDCGYGSGGRIGQQGWTASERDPVDAATRNQRNVWHLGPEPYAEAHFATFVSEIPRRAILAGTSAHGCCPKCFAPWVRVVEKVKIKRKRPNQYTKRTGEEGTGNSCANDVAGVEVITTGWKPGCECNAGESIPCTVIDPFGGSGTTGAVASDLGRYAILCELNSEYVELIRKRANTDQLRLFM